MENENDHCKAGEGVRLVKDGSVYNSMHNHGYFAKQHLARTCRNRAVIRDDCSVCPPTNPTI